MKTPNSPVEYSIAGPGQGTDDPKRVAVYDVDGGEQGKGSALVWFGNEYDSGSAWIFAAEDDFVEQAEME